MSTPPSPDSPQASSPKPSRPSTLPILYLDDVLVAVAKPSGLLVHRGWARDEVIAMSLVRDQLGRRVETVHRLDRATSGVLLFALDLATARRLNDAFAEQRIDKRYIALVRGITPEEGIIDSTVPKTPKGVRVAAETHFRRLDTFERFSLVEARPKTGRLHQIRRHLKHLCHPVIGDVRYGRGELNREFRQRFNLHRLALHALELRFEHPRTGKTLHLTAPVPEDLSRPLREMGLKIPRPRVDGK